MITIFMSGSISIKAIDEKVINRINGILEKNYNIILGDATGIDLLLQKYLLKNNYKNVQVYCSGDPSMVRNNVGNWEVVSVPANGIRDRRLFYTAKDLQMSKNADYGLMIWDKKSTGTLSNVIEMIKQNKKSRVFLSDNAQFISIRKTENIYDLVNLMDTRARAIADRKIELSYKLNELVSPKLSLF